MTASLRAAVLAAMAAFSMPAVVSGQQSSVDSLIRRIDSLERRTADLDQRVRALEAVIKSTTSQGQPIPSSTKWQDLANWRQLRGRHENG